MSTPIVNAPLGDGSSPLVAGTAPLGDGTQQAAAAPAVAAPAVAAAVDPAAAAPAVAVDPSKPVLADPAKAAEDAKVAEKAAAITAAEKAVEDAKTPQDKAKAARALAELKDTPGVAPENYEAFTLPEGVVADDVTMQLAQPLFKELGLSQIQAQKVVDFEAKRELARAEKHKTDWNAILTERDTQLRNDKEIGGANYDQSIASARAFVKAFGTPELQAFLNTDYAGSHPELIRAMARAGKAVSNDTIVTGSAAPAGQKPTPEYIMYPSMRQKA